jgi:hypothetical protein
MAGVRRTRRKLRPSGRSSSLKRRELTAAEEKVYLILTLLYRQIIKEAGNFQVGYAKWFKILPQKLAEYGLTSEEWTRISEIGDNSVELQGKIKDVEESL